MPQEIEGPDGQIHTFPDGVSDADIGSQMTKLYGQGALGADVGGSQTPPPDPSMPPGTVPGGMQPSMNGTDDDPTMVPLSPEAKHAQRMMDIMGYMGNRAGVMAANNRLQSDSTYQARKSESNAFGKNAQLISSKQEVGKRVFDEMNNLEEKARAWQQHAPGAFNGATGRWNSSDYVQDATGWMNPGASDLHTLLSHDIEKLATLYRQIPGAGPGGQMTDMQVQLFKDAIGKWMEARSPETAFAVLGSAKDLIRANSGLSPSYNAPQRPLSEEDVLAINKHATKPMAMDDARVTGVPGLHIGSVVNGYKFLGGNYDRPKNWEKAQ